MNFYAIAPLAASELALNHPYHMALAQYLYDDSYFSWMQEHISKGHTVILDSGVYENSPVDSYQLLYWVKKLQPYAVILPDKPNDMRETLKLSAQFAQMLDDAELPAQKWKVLHANSFEDFCLSYTCDSRLFDGVCFSKLTADFALGKSSEVDRPGFIRYLQSSQRWNSNCYHHALGMKDGSTNELAALTKLGVNSCDSSAPIWRYLTDGYLSGKGHPHPATFNPFGGPYNSNQLQAAQSAFQEVLNLCASK